MIEIGPNLTQAIEAVGICFVVVALLIAMVVS